MGMGIFDPLGSAPDARAYFFLGRQEKVAKKKATPSFAVGCADSPALLAVPGGWLNSPAAQTTPADIPRPFSVARRSTMGNRKPSVCESLRSTFLFAKKRNTAMGVSNPMDGAEQRRAGGGSRLALFEPQASLARRPTARVAQGSPEGATDLGCPFPLATFLLDKQKESTPARQARHPAHQKTQEITAGQRRKTAPN